MSNVPETTIHINEFEQVIIKGDYDNFTFDLMIYSEAFEAWVKQDISMLKLYASNYDALLKKIEKKLLKEGICNEQFSAV